jgi:Protein of unknown function (DUF3102)
MTDKKLKPAAGKQRASVVPTGEVECAEDSPRGLSTSNRLAVLAACIQQEHAACRSCLQRGLEHAVAAGKLLIEAKEQIPHGQWLRWLSDHVHIPERTAQRYMVVAPYAVDIIKNDNLANLTGDAVAVLAAPQSPDQYYHGNIGWDDVSAWAQWCLDRPFCDEDIGELGDGFNWHWVEVKLLHQAQVPALASILLSANEEKDEDEDDTLNLLCLCPFDELVEAARALAPIASGDRALTVNCSTMKRMVNTISTMHVLAGTLVGGILNEIDRRNRINDETYEREWRETHARWMAHLKAKLAEVQ